jgi:hypothetical protein
MQRKLDILRYCYSAERPTQALGGLTLEEAWSGACLPEPTAVAAHDAQPVFDVTRTKYRGDPHLPVFSVGVE